MDLPTAADVGRELRRLRVSAGETQAHTAAAIGVSRANLAQWEGGKYLPSEQNARQLDDHFRSGNALLSLAEAARGPHGQSPVAFATVNSVETASSLATVFQQVGRSLLARLTRDDQGRPVGWRHNLQTDRHVTAFSTACGIKAMLLIGEPYVDLTALRTSLLDMREAGHGLWVGRTGSLRPETVALALDALFRIGAPMAVDEAIDLARRSLDQLSRTRPYLLSTVLQTVLRLRPDDPLADELIDDLLATRLVFDGTPLWPEKKEPGLARPEASVVHTARAVVALRDVTHRSDVAEAVEQAETWLIGLTRPDDGVTEDLVRPVPGSPATTRVLIRHFTSAWVVQALSGAASYVPLARFQNALRTLWERYSPDLGLWAWGNGDLPIWMTLDSVAALRAAALTLATPPLSPPGDGRNT